MTDEVIADESDDRDEILRANMLRNRGPDWLAWYDSLPLYTKKMKVRCPTHTTRVTENGDVVREPIPEDDLPGCGSRNLSFSDVYDCCDCGIFFSDYAADPPHRRKREI